MENFKVGDRVRRRGFPHIRGKVWSIERGLIIVKWDDEEENAYVRNSADIEIAKISPRRDE